MWNAPKPLDGLTTNQAALVPTHRQVNVRRLSLGCHVHAAWAASTSRSAVRIALACDVPQSLLPRWSPTRNHPHVVADLLARGKRSKFQ